jgi:hypothetical protein
MSEVTELISGLRDFADFLALHPDLPDIYVGAFCGVGKQEMATVARDCGSAEKKFTDDEFRLTKKFGPIELVFYTRRTNVCQRVVVGTKEVPEAKYPERIVPAHTEEVVEWICDEPLLAATEQAETDAA